MEADIRLKAENITYAYGLQPVLQGVNLHVKRGEFVGIIGPNGSGKSTFLKMCYRALAPDSGSLLLDGENLRKMPYRKMALKIGVVGQENQIPFDFKVRDIVAMGRNPYKKLFDADTEEDRKIIQEAMEKTGISKLADRNYRQLSGGEKQRVVVARVLAQQTDFLILDEPTNHLDIRYQLSTLDLVRKLGVTVISAIHDLNLAAMFCDRIYLLLGGEIYAEGTPAEVLTGQHIKSVYEVETFIRQSTFTDKINIEYLSGNPQLFPEREGDTER